MRHAPRPLAAIGFQLARLPQWWPMAGVMALAALMRFIHLGYPHQLVFDETYYVKDGFSLINHGVELSWAEEPNAAFEAGDFSVLESTGQYVVHPPVGKWLIGFGMWLFGPESSFGWRFSVALAGTLSVLLVMLIARRLFNSVFWASLAGLFMAIDGQALVMSRVSLLDGFIAFFTLLALWLVLKDREVMDRRLALAMRRPVGHGRFGEPLYDQSALGPGLGMRWYLLLAGVSLGLACGVKWSGLYFVAVFGLMVAIWDVWVRRVAGVRWWLAGGLLRDAVKAFALIVPTAFVTYVGSWTGWLLTSKGYMRDWAYHNPNQGVTWLPKRFRSLLEYHSMAWDFHTGLDTPHDYESKPWDWLIQWRPTSMYLDSQPTCGSDDCTQAITALGNPLIWWFGAVALIVVIWAALAWADRRAWVILAGYLAGWAPWLLFAGRTVFTFYTVAFVPYVVLALTFALGKLVGQPGMSPGRLKLGRSLAGIAVVLTLATSAFFWPIWTAGSVPSWQWNLHYWLPTWY